MWILWIYFLLLACERDLVDLVDVFLLLASERDLVNLVVLCFFVDFVFFSPYLTMRIVLWGRLLYEAEVACRRAAVPSGRSVRCSGAARRGRSVWRIGSGRGQECLGRGIYFVRRRAGGAVR